MENLRLSTKYSMDAMFFAQYDRYAKGLLIQMGAILSIFLLSKWVGPHTNW